MNTVDKSIPAGDPVASKAAPKATARSSKPAAAAKPATASQAKPAAKPVAKAAAKPVTKPVAKPAPTKPVKLKKPKMVRDSFTFPKDEYEVLEALKLRAAKLGKASKKTEVLRAGLKAIFAMSDTALLAALQAVPSLKTGRPSNPKKAG